MALENCVVDCLGVLPAAAGVQLAQIAFANFPDPIVKATSSSSYTPEMIDRRAQVLAERLREISLGLRPATETHSLEEEIAYLQNLKARL